MEEYGREGQATAGNITRRMRFALWVSKPTGTHFDYGTLIVFLRQQWLRERASMLRYTYITLLVLSNEEIPVLSK
jgi:hypothetical protein